MTPRALERRLRRFLPFPRRRTLRRWFPPFEQRNIAHLIAGSGADLVVDIGANVGRYVEELSAAGARGPFLSVEPQSETHAILTAAAARARCDWTVAPRMAVGAAPGEIVIHRFADSSLASTLKPTAAHAGAAPFAPLGEEVAPVMRLDDLLAAHAPEALRPFVKIDVQGAEDAVLDGATETLRRAAGIQIELALAPAYEGETAYLPLLTRLDAAGFAPVYASRVVARRRLGPWRQMDVILTRKDHD